MASWATSITIKNIQTINLCSIVGRKTNSNAKLHPAAGEATDSTIHLCGMDKSKKKKTANM